MDESLFKLAANLIAEQTGLMVRELDDVVLAKVLTERVRELRLSGVEAYCQFLQSDTDLRREREALIIPLTTGETYFFRDSGQHALLRQKILPDLLARRKLERSLRIWSAACSSGEEAYSLAILLDELMPDQSRWNLLILGTDINPRSIDKALSGTYTEWSFRGVSEKLRRRYFQRHKNTWVLDDAIRRRVKFQTGDLVADAIPSTEAGLYGMDLILCRNAFIYMPPHVVSTVADKLTATLTEGGILVTGHGELYAHHLGQLRTRVFPESIIYQKVLTPYLPHCPEPHPAIARPVSPQRTVNFPGQQARTPAPAPAPVQHRAAAETVRKESDAEILQAWECANQGQRERAAEICNAMIASNPLDPDPHYLRALLAQEREEFATAKELLKKVIYLDHSFIAAYLDLGDLYAREKDEARAARMRSTARDFLRGLPGTEVVRLYGSSTVADVLHYVENLLACSRK